MNDEIIIFFLISVIFFLLFVILCQFMAYRIKPRAGMREISRKLKEINDTGNNEKVFTFTDNAELKELAAQINRLLEKHLKTKANYRHSEMASKKMLSNISHDIKTPLSAIKLYARALEKNLYSNPEKQREIAEKMNKKADEIEAFVSQVISACNEDFLNLTVQKGEFYLSQIMKQILEYYKEKLELMKTDFKVANYRDCILKGDLDRTVEVLQNIMENAIKYGDGHSVRMTFSSEEDCQLITISNSGCTLKDTELVHIFESFWRGSNSSKCNGSGLGLYICRQLMNKMGGEVFAECKEDEMSVTVVIPRA